MTSAHEVPLNDTVLGKIHLTDDQQLHLRKRELAGVPTMLEVSQFNTELGAYRLATPFPDDPRVLRLLISLLSHHLETAHDQA